MSGKKIVIDPITRIEGHLRIEVEIDENNVVTEAWASGQLFRGIELILNGRDPRDAGLIAQRICGVCTNVHYRASVASVENAYGIVPPKNAELVRNLISLALFVQDHLVHYYHLHSLDYVDVVSALDADIDKSVQTAKKYHKKPYHASATHLEEVKEKLASFVGAGRLGLFANGYWGHARYRLTPEQNLVHMNHYLEALRIQRELSKAIAIFAGKTPHPQNLVVGGITSVMDMLNPQRLNDYLFILKDTWEFIERAYLPDMQMLIEAYNEEIKSGDGRGCGNFLACGGYALDKDEYLFASGVITGPDKQTVKPFDVDKVTEDVTRSWYEGEGQTTAYKGQSQPHYTDLNEDGTLKSGGKYSWVKAPRYDGLPMEVGPVARMLIGYSQGAKSISAYMQQFMDRSGMTLQDFDTTIGRNAARAVEAQVCCAATFDYMNDLIENIKYYDEETWTKYDFETLPITAQGHAFYEVPRGVLSHFVRIEEARIANYQVIAPTTWNASPKDVKDLRGPYEESLIGLKLADPSQPLEVLRAVHSFDPCLACAVHVIDLKGVEISRYKISSACSI